MLTLQLPDLHHRRDRRAPLEQRTQPQRGADPHPQPRRRDRRRNTRRPPAGLVPVTYALVASAGGVAAGVVGSGQPYRMSQRARLAVTLTVVVAGVVMGLGSVLNTASGMTVRVTVSAGDSLWSIAEKMAPDADTGSIVDQISELNGLHDSVVRPGEVLEVPVP
jgi:LysM repeat protein